MLEPLGPGTGGEHDLFLSLSAILAGSVGGLTAQFLQFPRHLVSLTVSLLTMKVLPVSQYVDGDQGLPRSVSGLDSRGGGEE